MENQTSLLKALALVLSVTALLMFGAPIAIIEGGSRGIAISLGKIHENALPEGLNFVAPFVTGVKRMSIRVQKAEVEASGASKDLQTVHIKAIVNWQINPESVVPIYRKFGDTEEVISRLIAPENQSVIKTIAAESTAEQLLTKRQDFENNALKLLASRLEDEGITVTSVSITNMEFSAEFNKAIEQKQVAQQEAQKASYLPKKPRMKHRHCVKKPRVMQMPKSSVRAGLLRPKR